MRNEFYFPLTDRGIVTVKGKDAAMFLQGLVSSDVGACEDGRAVWAAILSPQGKYLFDFFISKVNDSYWIDCESARLMDLGRLLHKYKLRANIELGIGEGFALYALVGVENVMLPDGCVCYDDPRLNVMGKRVVLTKENEGLFQNLEIPLDITNQYHTLRIENGLPDGMKDMTPDKALLLENGFDELGGVDWNKGCYVGQELTARTKYRGLIKKRLLPVIFEGPVPVPGSEVTLNGQNAGEVKSSVNQVGLALLRLERLDLTNQGNENLMVGATKLHVKLPAWVKGVNS